MDIQEIKTKFADQLFINYELMLHWPAKDMKERFDRFFVRDETPTSIAAKEYLLHDLDAYTEYLELCHDLAKRYPETYYDWDRKDYYICSFHHCCHDVFYKTLDVLSYEERQYLNDHYFFTNHPKVLGHYAEQFEPKNPNWQFNDFTASYIREDLRDFKVFDEVSYHDTNIPEEINLLQYEYDYMDERLADVIHYWQDMISKKDFYYFSQRECLKILANLYLRYSLDSTCPDWKHALSIAMICWKNALLASPYCHRIKKEDTYDTPWLVYGTDINAFVKGDSYDVLLVRIWAIYADLLWREHDEHFKIVWKEALRYDRILFSETRDYVLKDFYLSAEQLVKSYDGELNDTELLSEAERLLQTNPAMTTEDFAKYINEKMNILEEFAEYRIDV